MIQKANKSLPLVSVGIPTYNGGHRIGKALSSLCEQNYNAIEILISDNASTDDTETVVRSFMEKDKRIHYFKQDENRGVTPNFEFALSKATGKYFFWISDDDEIIPGVLEKYVAFLEENPSYSLVSGEINYWRDGKLIERETGFNFEHRNGLFRSLGYYAKVKEGALLYGLMRRPLGQNLRFWPTIGSDWHFVAGLAYQGKVKTLDFVGYNKVAGGISSSFVKYARVFGEKRVWGYFPYVKIGKDAFAEYMWKSKVYRNKINPLARFLAGVCAFILVVFKYYFMIYPRMIGGRILRWLNIKTPRQKRIDNLRFEQAKKDRIPI